MPVKVVNESHVAPPPASVATTKIPLTFFDLAWLLSYPMQRLFFYESTTLHFTETIIPRLKQSLSLTLIHFFPLAANLICPPPPYEPYICYTEGDFVAVTVAESDADFNLLVANHPRDAQHFHSLVPKLAFPSVSLDKSKTHVLPVMAMQVTIFPNSGFSIGVSFIHVAADGRSFNHFMKSWASIYISGAADLTNSLSLPCHDKDVIKDPNGLSSIFMKDWWSWENFGSVEAVPEDLVRVTLVISRAQIEKLKQLVKSSQSINKMETHVSTYAVTCGLLWVNLIKLKENDKNISTGQLQDDLFYHFVCVADCRDRLEFPIPATYFGNCLSFFFVPAKRSELMGKDGIVFAATAIGRTIRGLEKGPLIGAEKWPADFKELVKHRRTVSVAGSPRLRVYDTDFGWGRPKKSEVVHLGAYRSFSLAEPRDEEGGVEIGLVLGRDKLDVFNVIFEQYLLNIQ